MRPMPAPAGPGARGRALPCAAYDAGGRGGPQRRPPADDRRGGGRWAGPSGRDDGGWTERQRTPDTLAWDEGGRGGGVADDRARAWDPAAERRSRRHPLDTDEVDRVRRPPRERTPSGPWRGGARGSERRNRVAEAAVATPAQEAAAAATPGFWVDHLRAVGALPENGSEPLSWRDADPNPPPFLDGEDHWQGRLAVNRILAAATDWRTPLTVARDCARLLDYVGAACAAHRLARLSTAAGVPLDAVKASPGHGALIAAAIGRGPKYTPRQMANILWALGKLGDRASPLLPAIVARLNGPPWSAWREQELANGFWAAASLGLADWPEAWAPLVAEITRRGLDAFETQAVSNIVWACAHLKHRNEELLQAVADFTVANRHRMTPQSMSNTVWALNDLQFYHSSVFDLASADVRTRMHAYKAQEMCNVLYAMAKSDHVDEAALAAFDAEVASSRRRAECTGQAIANILWAFANARFYPVKSLGALIGEVERRVDQFGEQELANCVWSLARLGAAVPPSTLAAVDARVTRIAGAFQAQACSNTLWALTVLGGSRLPSYAALAARLTADSGAASVDPIQVNQLFQSLFMMRLEREAAEAAGEAVAAIPSVPDDVARRVTDLWRDSASNTVVSVFQEDVSLVLRGLGVDHTVEFGVADGLFSVDIAVDRSPAGPRVAIEVDGPYHFMVNANHPTGATILRRRLLTMLGWTVVSVPYHEFATLATPRDRALAMARKLADAGVAVDPARLPAPDAAGPGVAVGGLAGGLGAGAPLGARPGSGAVRESPLAGASAAGAAPSFGLPAPPPRLDVPITPALAAAARLIALASQRGKGPRPREEVDSLGAVRRRDAATSAPRAFAREAAVGARPGGGPGWATANASAMNAVGRGGAAVGAVAAPAAARAPPSAPAPPSPDRWAQLMTMTLKELAPLCDAAGVAKAGRKADVVARLVDAGA